jgi:hypothetical protein
MFGTIDRQKKGADWKADPQKLATAFAHRGAQQDRSFATTVLKKASGKQLTLESSLQLSGLKYTLPDGFLLADDKFQMQVTSVLSTDESALPVEQLLMQYTAVSGALENKRVSEWFRESGHAKYRLLK